MRQVVDSPASSISQHVEARPDTRHAMTALRAAGLYRARSDDGLPLWRVSVEPYWLRKEDAAFLTDLGPRLLAFYRSLNRLYYQSLKTSHLAWVHRYLDRGKPEVVIEYGLMRRVRDQLPGILRPDLLAVDSGMIVSELDSVPGGFGLTAAFHDIYSDLGYSLLGNRDGIVDGFREMVGAGMDRPPNVAIVVSDESADYRAEMAWLARRLEASGLPTIAINPNEVTFHETGLTANASDGPRAIDVLYRFFELFDLKNIPKSELMLYAAKKETVRMTPPAKAFLEEKLALALWHHPALTRWWRDDLGVETWEALNRLIPPTWILDPTEVPPHAVIPGLMIGGRPVRSWLDLAGATQRDRRFVIKPSGFSERAWGSRGVVVGHDQSAEAWGAAIEAALSAYSHTPHVLQEFRVARRDEVAYYDEERGASQVLAGRTRLSPYYFVSGDHVSLGGVLATTCPLDKKVIHGMPDAVLAPCAVRVEPT